VFDEEDGDDALVETGKKKKKHKKKKGKYKKIGGKFAERYQLAFISPSVVPNYFPTMRVYEYNMTGLENTTVWAEQPPHGMGNVQSMIKPADSDEENVELRSIDAERKKGKKNKKGKKGKKDKKGKDKPKDPDLVIPEDPPKGSLPGPAYYPQQFTLLGYTQYFANLTRINNDQGDTDEVNGSKWRNGNHGDKTPKHKPAKPRKFQFEVEYSTFDDKQFKLRDLTVRSYLHLAYRMGQRSQKSSVGSGRVDEEGNRQVNAGKEKSKGKKKETNKTWLHWLNFAFVSTVSKDDLKKM
jgi:endopolyphosphatase